MNLPPLVRKALAEFLGVTLFMTALVGSVVYQQNPLGSAAIGAVLGLAILVTLPISGGHLNPIVSVYFFSRRELSLLELLAILLAQFSGALFGTLIASQMFQQEFQISTDPSTANMGALLSELFIAGGLVWLYGRLSSTSKAHLIPMAVGLWMFAAVVFSASGAQGNPAVSVALILVGQASGQSAAYILAHLAGMLIAAIFVLVFAERKRVMVENLEVEKPADLAKVAARKPAAKKTATK
jgi:glycerol uptake facilitator-like aquaporin